ncbi:MAG: hypothetical protein ABI894_14590 [Ilumatobacteraceae bacterium]
MVDYVPLSRRRRNAALVSVAALLVGLIAGVLVGRSTAITASEAAHDVRTKGDTLGTRIEALTIEYDQAIAGTGDTVEAGVLDALELIDGDIDKLVDESPWLGLGQVKQMHDATTALRTTAENRVDPVEFSNVAFSTAAIVRDTFGVLET